MELPVRIARIERVPPLPERPRNADAEEDLEEEEEGGSEAPSFQMVPVATYVLLALLALIYAAMYAQGHSPDISPAVGLLFGDKENALIEKGQIWQLVTPIFLHGSMAHLLMNSLSLWLLGAQMERLYGWRKYLIIFVLAGIAGNVASVLRAPTETSLGASGALFGLVGAGLIFPVRFRWLVPERARTEILRQLLIVAGINLLIGFGLKDAHLDNWAHLGGLAGGSIVALFLIPDALDARPPRLWSEVGVWTTLIASLSIVGWAAYSQWHWVQVALKPPPPLEVFQPVGSDPWWSIGLPRAWHPAPLPMTWTGPNGAILQIADEPVNSPLAQQMQTWLQPGPNQPKPSLVAVDGKPGFVLSLPETNAQRVLDLCIVPVYGRVLLLKMESAISPAPHQEAIQDFLRIVSSLRIVHWPADNAGNTAVRPSLPPGHAPPAPKR